MILTTAPSVEGRTIAGYKGVVFGAAVIGEGTLCIQTGHVNNVGMGE